MPEAQPTSVRHVLLDADDVLQTVPGGWTAAMRPYVGDRADEFLRLTWADERPTLAGHGDYLPMLAARLREYGVTVPVEAVYRDVWHRIEPDPASFALVETLRRNGYGVHLGTNQEQHRAAHMRTTLGYDALFDTSSYSHDLGVAKPDPAYFVAAAARIGDPPGRVLFVDDRQSNVDGAHAAGMRAVRWEIGDGHDTLVSLLEQHGVAARPTAAPGTCSFRP